LVLISITLAMVVLYGLFVSNIGTAYRMRAQVWLFWAVFAGWKKEYDLFPIEQDNDGTPRTN